MTIMTAYPKGPTREYQSDQPSTALLRPPLASPRNPCGTSPRDLGCGLDGSFHIRLPTPRSSGNGPRRRRCAMSWFSKSCDVLVVGAGPTGLFTALELARRGVSVRVIEEQWRTASRSYALGLHPRTLDMLDAHGIADTLVAKGHRLEAVSLRDASGEHARLD